MKTIEYTYNVKELANKVEEAVVDIKSMAISEENDYEVKGDWSLPLPDLEIELSKLSKNQCKKLQRSIERFYHKKSRSSANRFFHFLMKHVLQSEDRIKLLPSVKEQEIQRKRKLWVEARNAAQKALNEYKQEKGNFYKNKVMEAASENERSN